MSVGLPDEGYIKFDLRWRKAMLPEGTVPQDLLEARNQLFRLGLVGVYGDSGIGFGNVSCRLSSGGRFVVSGSGTGSVADAGSDLYAIVEEVDIGRNLVACQGMVPASSESLTHAMLYQCGQEIGCVLHVHSMAVWERVLYKIPTTAKGTPYGTPEMALEVKRLWQSGGLDKAGVMAMAGHSEGLVAAGRDVGDAMIKILGLL